MDEYYRPVLIDEGPYILIGTIGYGTGWEFEGLYNERTILSNECSSGSDSFSYLLKTLVVL